MYSLRGMPVEYELDAYNMPSTGTTSCHPQNWLRRPERNSALDTSSLVHINGDNTDSPPPKKIPDTQNYTVTLNTIPHTSINTLPSQHLATPFRLHTNKPKLRESCSTKSKPYSMLQ